MCPVPQVFRTWRRSWSGPRKAAPRSFPAFRSSIPTKRDVMRGEEVQLLGAHAAGLVPADALVCHPGTHNKWARLEGGRIARFRR